MSDPTRFGRAIARIVMADGSAEECWYGAYMVARVERAPQPVRVDAQGEGFDGWQTIWTPETGWTG